KIAKFKHGGDRSKRSQDRLNLAEAAKQVGTSEISARRANAVINRGVRELREAVEQKKIGLLEGADIARKSKAEQRAEVKRLEDPDAAPKPKKPKPEKHVSTADAQGWWHEASDAQKRKFIDNIGFRSVWAIFTKDQRIRCIKLGA